MSSAANPSWIKNFIYVPANASNKGAPFGVEVGHDNGYEIHGPFKTSGQAHRYAEKLFREYTDYDYYKVVEISLVGVPFDEIKG